MSTTPRQQPRISRLWPFRNTFYGWAILTAGVFSSFATVSTQGPIIGLFNQPIRDDLGWSATDISLGFVIGSVAGGFFSSFVGRILDKRGARAVAVVAGLIIACVFVAISRMQSPWHWWVLFGIARGTAASGAQLSTMVSIASWFVRKRGRVVGILGIGQRGGQAIMPYPLVAIMALLSWRDAWFALAGMVILLQVLPSLVLLRRRPEDYGLEPDGDVTPDDETPEQQQARSRANAEASWTLAEARRSKTLWLLILAQGGVVLSLNATNLHAAAHLQDRGLSLNLAATVTTIFAAASAITVLPWGIAMERLHTRTLGMIATAMLVGAMMLLLSVHSFWVGAAFGLVYGVAVGAWTVVSRMLFANYFGRAHFGSIRGFAAPIMAIVNPLGPLLAAWFRDTRGAFDLGFVFFAVVFIVSFIAFLLAVPPKRRVEAPAP